MHIQITVLPSHLFKYFASETPYLIGELTTFRDRLQVDQTSGIRDIFCINLGIDEMSTINMVNPRYYIPDFLLIQQNRKCIDVSKNLVMYLSTIRNCYKERRSFQEIMSLEQWATCENERSKELLRSLHICFFLEMFEDMGICLSISREGKKFWMDRKKYY